MGLYVKKDASTWVPATSIYVKASTSLWQIVKKIYVKTAAGVWNEFWPKAGPYTDFPPELTSDAAGANPFVNTTNQAYTYNSDGATPTLAYAQINPTLWTINGGTGTSITSFTYQSYVGTNPTPSSGIGGVLYTVTGPTTTSYASTPNYITIDLSNSSLVIEGDYLVFSVTATRSDSVTGMDSSDTFYTSISSNRPIVTRRIPTCTNATITSSNATGSTVLSYTGYWNYTPGYAPDPTRSSIIWISSTNSTYTTAASLLAAVGTGSASIISTGVGTPIWYTSVGQYTSTLTLSTLPTVSTYYYVLDEQQNSYTDFTTIPIYATASSTSTIPKIQVLPGLSVVSYPEISGSGVYGNTITGTAGVYSNYASITSNLIYVYSNTSTNYYNSTFPSKGFPTYTWNNADDSAPATHIVTMDTVVDNNGLTSYYFSAGSTGTTGYTTTGTTTVAITDGSGAIVALPATLSSSPAYTSTSTSGGWSASVTTLPSPSGGNYSIVSYTAGTAPTINSSTGAITQTGLAAGATSSVTIQYYLVGYTAVTLTVSGQADNAVAFSNSFGTGSGTQVVTPGGSILLNTAGPVTNYVFNGWYTGPSGTGTLIGGSGASYTPPAGVTTLYAQYTYHLIPSVSTGTIGVTTSTATVNWYSGNQSTWSISGSGLSASGTSGTSHTFTGLSSGTYYSGTITVASSTGDIATATFSFTTTYAAPTIVSLPTLYKYGTVPGNIGQVGTYLAVSAGSYTNATVLSSGIAYTSVYNLYPLASLSSTSVSSTHTSPYLVTPSDYSSSYYFWAYDYIIGNNGTYYWVYNQQTYASPASVVSYPTLSGTAVAVTSITANAGSYNGYTYISSAIAYSTVLASNPSSTISTSSPTGAAIHSSPYSVTTGDATSPALYFWAYDTASLAGTTYYAYSAAKLSSLPPPTFTPPGPSFTPPPPAFTPPPTFTPPGPTFTPPPAFTPPGPTFTLPPSFSPGTVPMYKPPSE